MNLGEKIKHYREGLRWTLEHLSDLSGVEKGTISALEVRKSKRSEFAGKIAAAFGLSVNQLLGDQDFLRELKAGKRPIELESNRDIAAPVRAYAGNRIWVIGNGQGGLPDRIWTDGDHPVGASDKYAEVATDDDHAFVVCVRGDSMIPRYQPGEYALVEPDTAPEIEDDVLVRLESGETRNMVIAVFASRWIMPATSMRSRMFSNPAFSAISSRSLISFPPMNM